MSRRQTKPDAGAGASTYMSVSRDSFQGKQNTVAAESCSPRRAECERAKERVSRGPKMSAVSNYEMSFQEGQASPVRSCKPSSALSAPLPFTANSTSRSSFAPTRDDDFAARVHSPTRQATHSVPFTATTNSRHSYGQHQVKVPVLVHEHRRPLTHTKFSAISTNQATFNNLPPPA